MWFVRHVGMNETVYCYLEVCHLVKSVLCVKQGGVESDSMMSSCHQEDCVVI